MQGLGDRREAREGQLAAGPKPRPPQRGKPKPESSSTLPRATHKQWPGEPPSHPGLPCCRQPGQAWAGEEGGQRLVCPRNLAEPPQPVSTVWPRESAALSYNRSPALPGPTSQVPEPCTQHALQVRARLGPQSSAGRALMAEAQADLGAERSPAPTCGHRGLPWRPPLNFSRAAAWIHP